MSIIFIQQTKLILIIQQCHIAYSFSTTPHHYIKLVIFAEIPRTFFIPVDVRMIIRTRSILKSFQISFRILQRQAIIIQCFVLCHGIGISICHFRPVDREIKTMTIVHVHIKRIIHTSFGIHQNYPISSSGTHQSRSDTIFQNLDGLYFFYCHISQSPFKSIHQYQGFSVTQTTTATYIHDSISTPANCLSQMKP